MLGHLGFSYVGLIYLLALMIPNILWMRRTETHDSSGESKALLALERVGQVLCVVTLLIFSDTNPKQFDLWMLWLVASALLMVMYECYWIRYFRSERTVRDFYRPMLGIPVPGAALPSAAFLLLGVYGRLVGLIAAAVIFGVGHIGIHWGHVKDEMPRSSS